MDIAMTLNALEGMINALKHKTPQERIQAWITIRSILEEFYNYIDRSAALRDTPGALEHILQMLEPLRIKDKELAKIQDIQWLKTCIAYLRNRKCFSAF